MNKPRYKIVCRANGYTVERDIWNSGEAKGVFDRLSNNPDFGEVILYERSPLFERLHVIARYSVREEKK